MFTTGNIETFTELLSEESISNGEFKTKQDELELHFFNRLNLDNRDEKGDLDENDGAPNFSIACKSEKFTHIEIKAYMESSYLKVLIRLYSFFLKLDPIGPFIEGNLAVSGTCLLCTHGPALCKVEYFEDENDLSSSSTILSRVMPWDMIFPSSEEDNEDGNFTDGSKFCIPVSVENFDAFQKGIVCISIYIDDLKHIQYGGGEGELSAEVRNENDMIKSIELYKKLVKLHDDDYGKYSDAPEISRDKGAIKVITEVEIAIDYQEALKLQNNGYEIATIECNQDFCTTRNVDDDDSNERDRMEETRVVKAELPDESQSSCLDQQGWKLFICAKGKCYKSHEERAKSNVNGVEDVLFVRSKKSSGAIPEVPLYEVSKFDLSSTDSDYAVHIAIRYGCRPSFEALHLVYQAKGDNYMKETLALTNSKFVEAPEEISNDFGNIGAIVGIRGILLKDMNISEEIADNAGNPMDLIIKDNSPDDTLEIPKSFSKSEVYQHEANKLQFLNDDIVKLRDEADLLKRSNIDIERKIAFLLGKSSQYNSSSIGGRLDHNLLSDREEVKDGIVEDDQLQVNETNSEKERLYFETMKLIALGRKKYDKQGSDYKKLTIDLQARLHDKEMKLSEIAASFKEFRDEIINGAENSRTGLPLSKTLAAQFDSAQNMKSEELEKARLKNISLRQTIRKLEKSLKSREQLAEGLHMIDFEQLKIENQTLNEKIEERNEEYTKLKRKKILTIQVLTHVREKLRFVSKQNVAIKQTLGVLETEINVQRGYISNAKKDRDCIKEANVELKRLHGFAGSELLLRDFDGRRNDIDSMKVAIRELQERKQLLSHQIHSNVRRTKDSILLRSKGLGNNTLPPLVR